MTIELFAPFKAFKLLIHLFQVALQLSGMLKIPRLELLPVSAVFLKLILVILFNRKFIYLFKTNYYRVGGPRIGWRWHVPGE